MQLLSGMIQWHTHTDYHIHWKKKAVKKKKKFECWQIQYVWDVRTFSEGRSIPKLPRERMIPSASWRISSKCIKPWRAKVINWMLNNRTSIKKWSKRQDNIGYIHVSTNFLLTSTVSTLANIWVSWRLCVLRKPLSCIRH